ncbi:MAG: TetR/AcrR family transcriptional regulator [Rhizobiaceae bacterium]
MASDVQENLAGSAEAPVGGNRREILDAAANCFMERGYSTTSIDDVARRLGSTKGRIYHHYPSKADLFAGVFRTAMDLNFRIVLPLTRHGGNAAERLIAMARAHTRNMIETRAYQRAVWEGVELHLRGATTPEQRTTLAELTRRRDAYEHLFKATLDEAGRAGDLTFDNLSIANQVMLTALNSPIVWYSPRDAGSGETIDNLVEQVVTFAMRGLGYQGDITS